MNPGMKSVFIPTSISVPDISFYVGVLIRIANVSRVGASLWSPHESVKQESISPLTQIYNHQADITKQSKFFRICISILSKPFGQCLNRTVSSNPLLWR